MSRLPSPMPKDEVTGLPGLKTWSRVYSLVLAVFVLWVALLAWLTFRYS